MEDRHHRDIAMNAGAGNGKRVILWIVQKTMFQAFVFSLQLWFRSNNDTLFNIYVTLRWENSRVFFALFRFIFTFEMMAYIF